MNGLIGTGIANFTIPNNRRVEVSLAVFHHCAQELSLRSGDLFRQAAAFAQPELAVLLIRFGDHADVTLIEYGWKTKYSEDGVSFTYSWN